MATVLAERKAFAEQWPAPDSEMVQQTHRQAGVAVSGERFSPADSASPCPRPLITRFTCTCPLAKKTTSIVTSPSNLRLRPSAVYSGRGLSKIVTAVSAGPSLPAFFLGASEIGRAHV